MISRMESKLKEIDGTVRIEKRNQINGVNGIYKTIGMHRLNWNRKCSTDLMVELRAWNLWNQIQSIQFQSN